METERIALSQRERGRLRVLHEVKRKQITQIEAARRLKISDRHTAILSRVRQRYADFGPTLAAEHFAQEGLLVSRETLRKWMVQASLWRPRAQGGS